MDFDFLSPVDDVLIAHNNLLPRQSFGRNIAIHTTKSGMPELTGVKLAIVGVSEYRNAGIQFKKPADLTAIRYQLYRLFNGNWNFKIADLGNISNGAEVEDSYFAVKEMVTALLKKKVTPIIIGGSQDITYAMYRAYDSMEQLVNIVSVDNRFDFGNSEELISSQSYMSRIIIEKPNRLYNFCNIGFQTFYNAQEEIDLMDNLFFEAHRLGEVVDDITVVEPSLRDADLVSLDMSVVKASDVANAEGHSPNGLSGMDMCAIARYAGISDRVSSFGIFDIQQSEQFASLVSQMIWYFIEGVNYRFGEYPFGSKKNFIKYTVLVEDEALVFFKSPVSHRWWVEVPIISTLDNNLKRTALLPCTHQDYLDACNQKIPERWWKAYRKTIN
ncbi:formimidoylglutamase [Sungkyunkwania multivorans]|uniref:Formimidoylglutamase n=1 Tax=Sungkyunkwania multivorans TaxID=1173618 RepID=A0ABW3D2S1_9FLAO